MTIKQQIDQDLKQALLGGDKSKAMTLRGLKSAILYAEVDKNKKDTGLDNNEVMEVLGREVKKRIESAELYEQGGNKEKQTAELAEKQIIEKYLPKQLTESEISQLVGEVINQIGNEPQKIGQIIGAVKQKAGPTADGATIAKMVKDRLA